MAFGAIIKEELKLRGKSAAWLSRETGIPATTIRSLISRDSWSINPSHWEKILKALDLTERDLFLDEDTVVNDFHNAAKFMLRTQNTLLTDLSYNEESGEYLWEVRQGKESFIVSDETLDECFSEAAKFYKYLLQRNAIKDGE